VNINARFDVVWRGQGAERGRAAGGRGELGDQVADRPDLTATASSAVRSLTAPI
jgi:hypothetical protein